MIEIEERHNEGAISRVFELLSQLGYESYVLEGISALTDRLGYGDRAPAVALRESMSQQFFFLPRGIR
jgi:hypothetical protein